MSVLVVHVAVTFPTGHGHPRHYRAWVVTAWVLWALATGTGYRLRIDTDVSAGMAVIPSGRLFALLRRASRRGR